MNERTLEVLEYDRVREEIAGQCMSEEGRASFLSLTPSADAAEIARLKSFGRAWMDSLSAEDPPRLLGWQAVGPLFSRLRVEGASLECAELFSLGQFCRSVTEFREWALARARRAQSGRRDVMALTGSSDAVLVEFASAVPDLSAAETGIFQVIDRGTGEVRDLPELRAIRQGIRKIRQDIERLIGTYLSDDGLKTALQSTLPTLRDGRQVIAVRANFRGRVRGIVHEVSQSGQTVYVEPEDVVDRNNDLVSEEARLSREIARILRELTATLAPDHPNFVEALERMVFIDRVAAAARWGRERRCVFAADSDAASGAPGGTGPSDAPIVSLRQARHPLLRERAVPIDLALPPRARVLIITGPNTGGKTVSLKTVALFALLNQSGWPLPAAEGTALPIFDFVGCDIGDEQSLDQSLSTFSGHMKNIAGILSAATSRSLVLLDELASGTDPQEGSAIAMAVLDRLLEKGSFVLATTHHGILKNYGYTHASCVNASVDFDQNTLSPTYRILMGVPGESHALDIASRNGLDPEIVASARSYLAEERADVSALIRGLTAKHEELAGFETEKRKEEAALREKRRKTDLKELQLRQRELELREQGYRRLDSLLAESRRQLENLVREIREGELTREKTLQVKAWMAELDERVAEEYDGLEASRRELGGLKDAHDAARRLEDEERAREEASSPKPRSRARSGTLARAADSGAARTADGIPDLAPGVEVYIGAARRRGTLVREEKGGKWIVAAGPVRMTVAATELSGVPVSSAAVRTVSIDVQADMGGDDVPAFELRLIGMREDEARRALSRQLDLASMKGLKEFSVVHGKGHGILQTAVHEILKGYAAVSDFAFARPEDGGTGKTIVRLG